MLADIGLVSVPGVGFHELCIARSSVWFLVDNRGMGYWTTVGDYIVTTIGYRDPFPHSLLRTRQSFYTRKSLRQQRQAFDKASERADTLQGECAHYVHCMPVSVSLLGQQA